MADFSVPGVSSKYKTDEVIKKLVEVEKIPLKRMEESVGAYKNQAQVWREVNQGLGRLRDAARGLYGFQSPFGDKRAVSADPNVISATVTREATEGKLDVLVKRIATADKFLSKPLPLDYSVPEGKYTFRVGNDEVRFTYRGGKLSSFIQTLNSRGEGIIRAQAVRATADSQTLMVESLKTGAENLLTFHDDAASLAQSAGFLEKAVAGSRKLTLDANAVKPWIKPGAAASVQSGVLKLSPGMESSVPISPGMPIADATVLELEVKVSSRKGEIPPPPSPPPGPAIPSRRERRTSAATSSSVPVCSSPQFTLPHRATLSPYIFFTSDRLTLP